jgi:hypothetical protein
MVQKLFINVWRQARALPYIISYKLIINHLQVRIFLKSDCKPTANKETDPRRREHQVCLF